MPKPVLTHAGHAPELSPYHWYVLTDGHQFFPPYLSPHGLASAKRQWAPWVAELRQYLAEHPHAAGYRLDTIRQWAEERGMASPETVIDWPVPETWMQERRSS